MAVPGCQQGERGCGPRDGLRRPADAAGEQKRRWAGSTGVGRIKTVGGVWAKVSGCQLRETVVRGLSWQYRERGSRHSTVDRAFFGGGPRA